MTTERPLTVDCQVHCYERNRPERPWSGYLQGPDEVTGDDMVVAMDAVGVDGAILISPFSMYRFDASYALECQARHPARFGLVRPFDPHSDSIPDQMAEWVSNAGVVGARVMLSAEPFEANHPGINQILVAAAGAGIPVNMMCSTRLEVFGELARRNPNTQLIIDHLGIVQPAAPPAPDDAWASLPEVLGLAALDNVAIKISGACTLSHQPFPYADIWEPLQQIFDAYGLERCMWGTDWTRATNLLNYEQGVESFRVTDQLSDAERATLMGGTLTRIYNWAPGQG